MCGIAGFLGGKRFVADEASAIARRMADAVAHRGPDDAGVWLDGEAGVALAHQRLAVIDLSPAGHQPMISASGRSVIVFNGEIYNHAELRRRLDAQCPGLAWRGHSDTETLLAAIEHWGLEEALRAATGMFAFAFWDRRDGTLSLARDRLGEKPLYYGWQNGVFLFGSELAARLMAVDALSYLPDDLLVKVDRTAMGVSLETRTPFLDHHVVEFVLRLPLSLRLRNAQSKWILRQVLDRYVPRPLVERPKAGFSVPLASWLRGTLRDWAEALLDGERLRQEGFFDPRPIRREWQKLLNGYEQCEPQIWSILMFQAWLAHNRRSTETTVA